FRKAGAEWVADTWLMSCRVLGRRVEEAVLAEVAAAAKAAGAQRLVGRYVPTARNRLVADHYARLGFSRLGEAADGTTTWALDLAAYRPPDLPIRVERA